MSKNEYAENKARMSGMEAPEKLRFYIKEKKFTQEVMAGMLGVSKITIAQWLCCHSRPRVAMRYAIQYLTKGCGDVHVEGWLTGREKEEIAQGIDSIRRLRRSHVVPKLSIRDQLKGRL